MANITDPAMLVRCLARMTGHQDHEYDQILNACRGRYYANRRLEEAEARAKDAEAVARNSNEGLERLERHVEDVRAICSHAVGIPGPMVLPFAYIPKAIEIIQQEHLDTIDMLRETLSAPLMDIPTRIGTLAVLLDCDTRWAVWAKPAPDNTVGTPAWYSPPRVALYGSERAAQASADECLRNNDAWRFEPRVYTPAKEST